MNRTCLRTRAWSRSSRAAVVARSSSPAPLGLLRMGSIPSCAMPPAVPPARGRFLSYRFRLSPLSRKPRQLVLLAVDDLRDARAVKPDLIADLPQREPFLLSLSEGFAPRLLGRGGIALVLLLSGADSLSSFGLFLRHLGDPSTRLKM